MLMSGVANAPSLLDASQVYPVVSGCTPHTMALCERLGRSGTPVTVCLINDDPKALPKEAPPALTDIITIPTEGELEEYL